MRYVSVEEKCLFREATTPKAGKHDAPGMIPKFELVGRFEEFVIVDEAEER